jgi:hypothetical protein
MLENLSATGSNNLRQISDRHEETSAPKPMISLNDTEYGKY